MQIPNSEIPKKYNLEERTAKFGEDIVKFAKLIPVSAVTQRIIPQLVASETAIGSNYCEADDAESGKDFKHKIGVSKKEARETKYWLRIIATATPELKENARKLWQEAKELHLILNAISRKVSSKNLELRH